jgi:hypothetical protein
VSWTFKKSMRLTTENPFAWAVVALRLRRVVVRRLWGQSYILHVPEQVAHPRRGPHRKVLC